MKHETLKSFLPLFVASVTALCLVSTPAQAQTSPSVAPSASMPQGHMQQGSGGSENMKQSMMTGMESMQKMQMSGDNGTQKWQITNDESDGETNHCNAEEGDHPV